MDNRKGGNMDSKILGHGHCDAHVYEEEAADRRISTGNAELEKAEQRMKQAGIDKILGEGSMEDAVVSPSKKKDDKGKVADRKQQQMIERIKKIKGVEERKKKDEEERLRKEEEERRRQEEVERIEEEKRRLKKEREKEKMLRKKQEGKLLTGKQKEEARRLEAMRKQFLASESQVQENQQDIVFEVEANGVEEDEEWDAKSTWDATDLNIPGKTASEEEEEIDSDIKETMSAASDAAPTIPENIEPEVGVSEETSGRSEYNLRSPICCIMGHVDTGKTKLLDCIRGTNVQEGEAGGITQQIGATYFPAENIRKRTKELKADANLKVPGLLFIDTPGHESFTNLRSRGSGLCDMAILVVDIMHGLERQTVESLNLLKMRNTNFVIALNKVDRLYGWKACENASIMKAMKQQSRDVQSEFRMRLTQVVTEFKEQGINTELYYKSRDMGKGTFSIVPTSAISGEGIPDLLLLLVQWTAKTMAERLTYSNEVQCTVLEVKVVEGHGTTIDVILVNGVLHDGDQIVVCGMQGPIVTSIRSLLTPDAMKELRVKGSYEHHKEIKAVQGIKITAQGLEHAIAGTSLYVVGPDDDMEGIKEAVKGDMRSVMSRVDKCGEGVYVQASTRGSLEALLEFLKTPEVNIPVSGIGIGNVHKKDATIASVMLEKKKEYATILAFDVRIAQDAKELADKVGVKIYTADIIYNLFYQFKAYIDNLKEEKKKLVAEEVVFPCKLKIIPNCVFNKKDPIVLGVEVLEGIAKVGTPICIQQSLVDIGRIASIMNKDKSVDSAKKGQQVSIKIIGSNTEKQQKMFGRHFQLEGELVSKISRRSIDILKANYRNDLSVEDWKLVVKQKAIFNMQ
ncbi:eukaryotic translation initiation factor 5B-like [Capsicum chacoense]